MAFFVNLPEGDEPAEEALMVKLRRFVEDSDDSLYQIAELMGISGAVLSMWLAGTAKPHPCEWDQIERFLRR
jgi:DNA transposition AAA+ family ATPase